MKLHTTINNNTLTVTDQEIVISTLHNKHIQVHIPINTNDTYAEVYTKITNLTTMLEDTQGLNNLVEAQLGITTIAQIGQEWVVNNDIISMHFKVPTNDFNALHKACKVRYGDYLGSILYDTLREEIRLSKL